MDFQVTVRYGADKIRYHLDTVRADDLRAAMRAAADGLPDEVAAAGDLVEIRPALDREARSYLGDEEEEAPDPPS